MSITVPPSHKLNELTSEYGVSDGAMSGGDIGALIPIYSVVWVSWLNSNLAGTHEPDLCPCEC